MEPVLYAPPELWQEDQVTLAADESHHLVTVLRGRIGELVIVADGEGGAGRGEIVSLRRSGCIIRLIQPLRNFGEPTVRLTLAAGLSTGYKFDSTVDKGTQLGVTRFVPLITAKATVRLPDSKRARTRQRRLEKVALAAMKQSRRSVLPQISAIISLERFLTEVDSDDVKLIFDAGASLPGIDAVAWPEASKRFTVLVGPESGFSSAEVAAAREVGFVAVSLGRRILRAETAGPVICALLMNRLGELS
ncbi:MAG: RsmE family RNA methyltransferase [bacterium]